MDNEITLGSRFDLFNALEKAGEIYYFCKATQCTARTEQRTRNNG